jgi:hypothetical protein
MLREIFGPNRDDVTGEWRKIYNEEIHDLYCSPNVVRVIKSRRTRWVKHIARMGERHVYGFGGRILGNETTGETQK